MIDNTCMVATWIEVCCFRITVGLRTFSQRVSTSCFARCRLSGACGMTAPTVCAEPLRLGQALEVPRRSSTSLPNRKRPRSFADGLGYRGHERTCCAVEWFAYGDQHQSVTVIGRSLPFQPSCWPSAFAGHVAAPARLTAELSGCFGHTLPCALSDWKLPPATLNRRRRI